MAKVTTLTPFSVTPRALNELIIMPHFADFLAADGQVIPSMDDGDWMIMDGVSSERPILELKGGTNVIKRKDATCRLIPGELGTLSSRNIRVTELYAYLEECRDEFYQGCFDDFRNQDAQRIFAHTMPFLQKAFALDFYTNMYFGDLSRPPDPSGYWNWNKFDGIFTAIAKYIEDGTIPSSQTYTIPNGKLTGQQAVDVLEALYEAQSPIMYNYSDSEKAFYVDQSLAKSYHNYLVQSGQSTISERMLGKMPLMFEDIEIRPKLWGSILGAIHGGVIAHAAILTVRSNFIFATDNTWGGGMNRNEGARVWYSMDDNVWRSQIFVKAGTELASPSFIVIGAAA